MDERCIFRDSSDGCGASEANGHEVMWLAETKGEIRPNTALKSEAARLWCGKMSRTAYGDWRYLFIRQRKLEAALAGGVRSLAGLAGALVEPHSNSSSD